MSLPPPTERQARIIWFSLTTLAVASGLALVAGICWGLSVLIHLLSPVIWPFAVAVVLAYLLSPVVNWLEGHGLPRLRAIALVFAAAGVLALGALGSVLPRAILEARDLASQVPTFASRIQTKAQAWLDHPPAPLRSLLPADWQRRLDEFQGRRREATNAPAPASRSADETPTSPTPTPVPAAEASAGQGTNAAVTAPAGSASDASAPWWSKAINPGSLRSVGTWFATVTPEILRWAAGQVGRVASVFGLIAGLFLIPVYAFFLLLEERQIARSWTDYLPVADARIKKEAVFVIRSINDALIVFFRGQVLVAFCDGILYAIGFLLIGLPYALLIGLMACFVTIIPFLGAAVTCGAALIIAVVQFGDLKHPMLVLLVFSVVQFIEGFVLQPKIVGDRVGLHPLTVIVALMVGTTLLGGILGGVLAIPLTAALRVLMAHYVWKPTMPDGAPAGAVSDRSVRRPEG